MKNVWMIHVKTSEQLVDRCYEGGRPLYALTFSALEIEALYHFLSQQHATKYPMPSNHPNLMNAMPPCVHYVQGHHGVWSTTMCGKKRRKAKQASPRIHDFIAISYMDTCSLETSMTIGLAWPIPSWHPFSMTCFGKHTKMSYYQGVVCS